MCKFENSLRFPLDKDSEGLLKGTRGDVPESTPVLDNFLLDHGTDARLHRFRAATEQLGAGAESHNPVIS